MLHSTMAAQSYWQLLEISHERTTSTGRALNSRRVCDGQCWPEHNLRGHHGGPFESPQIGPKNSDPAKRPRAFLSRVAPGQCEPGRACEPSCQIGWNYTNSALSESEAAFGCCGQARANLNPAKQKGSLAWAALSNFPLPTLPSSWRFTPCSIGE